jgi:hypothetical protein
MKNPIDSAMFIDSFDFLTTEYKFIRKGTLFIRLVNNEMIQTVCMFKMDPISIDINIGIFSVFEDIYPSDFKEGRIRLSGLESQTFYLIYDPVDTLLEVRKEFVEKAIPVFKDVTTLEKLIEFIEIHRLYDRNALFLANVKLGEMQKAYETLEDREKFELEGLEVIRRYEHIYPKDTIMQQNELIEIIRTKKRAIENNDTDFLNAILDTNYLNNKKMLEPYGIFLN